MIVGDPTKAAKDPLRTDATYLDPDKGGAEDVVMVMDQLQSTRLSAGPDVLSDGTISGGESTDVLEGKGGTDVIGGDDTGYTGMPDTSAWDQEPRQPETADQFGDVGQFDTPIDTETGWDQEPAFDPYAEQDTGWDQPQDDWQQPQDDWDQQQKDLEADADQWEADQQDDWGGYDDVSDDYADDWGGDEGDEDWDYGGDSGDDWGGDDEEVDEDWGGEGEDSGGYRRGGLVKQVPQYARGGPMRRPQRPMRRPPPTGYRPRPMPGAPPPGAPARSIVSAPGLPAAAAGAMPRAGGEQLVPQRLPAMQRGGQVRRKYQEGGDVEEEREPMSPGIGGGAYKPLPERYTNVPMSQNIEDRRDETYTPPAEPSSLGAQHMEGYAAVDC